METMEETKRVAASNILVPVPVSKRIHHIETTYDPLIDGPIYTPEELLEAAQAYVDVSETEELKRALADECCYLSLKNPWTGWDRWSRPLSPSRARSSSRPRHVPDEMKWRVVPRNQQLMEGNLQRWLIMMEGMLRNLSLLDYGIACGAPNVKLGDRTLQFQRDDSRACSIILMFVDPFFLTSQPIEPSITACGLLTMLSQKAKSFRLMDLPYKLGCRIYEYMVPTDEDYDETTYESGFWSPKGRLQEDRGSNFVRLATVRKLCAVSREFKEEVSRIHYSSNSFIVECNKIGPEIFQRWADVVGSRNLRHLRDVKASFWYEKGCFDTYHVTYNPSVGLNVEVIAYLDFSSDLRPGVADEHLAIIEKRKTDEAWEGSGIIEFFTLRPNALRSMLYKPLFAAIEHDDDFEYRHPPNDRDPYQVAYGQCFPNCPW